MPGLTNRMLTRVASAAAVTYDESVAFFGVKAFVAGNPVRPEFFGGGDESRQHEGAYDEDGSPRHAARVLVFGGSQGAHAINVAMVEAAPRLAAATPRLAITHQTGERDLEMVRHGYRSAGLEARVEPFLYEMDREMRAADIVVSREGSTTLAELAATGTAAILIPLPTATDDHQRKNAQALVRLDAAQMIDPRELTGERLATEVAALAADAGQRERMQSAIRRTARPDAAKVIVDKVLELAR